MKGGDIVQVQGGHIIRSTGRKDRHSKVYTAKGPRDRRVRLSAHTAIQFYDVQDRLGYDRPSKAVDWLILKAKNAINELPPWNPAPSTDDAVAPCSLDSNQSSRELLLDGQSEEAPTNSEYPLIHLNDNININNNYNTDGSGSSLFIQPDAANLVNSMKTFFPTNSMSYPDFSNDVIPRASFQAEDLGLSLQSLRAENGNPNNNNTLPSGSSIVGFQESFQRMDNWNNGGSTGNMEDSRIHGFVMNSQVPGLFSPGFPFSQRELLQSNLLVHAWNNEHRPLATTDHQNPPPRALQLSDSGSHFAFGFHVPTPIYGDHDEETNH